jgi:hypothetical protein
MSKILPLTSDLRGKTLVEVCDLARQRAERRGHTIAQWDQQRTFRFTATCQACRAGVEVYSRALETPISAGFESIDGVIVVRDRDHYWTGLDYNWAAGEALLRSCSGRRSAPRRDADVGGRPVAFSCDG